jgi:hypothetical protein
MNWKGGENSRSLISACLKEVNKLGEACPANQCPWRDMNPGHPDCKAQVSLSGNATSTFQKAELSLRSWLPWLSANEEKAKTAHAPHPHPSVLVHAENIGITRGRLSPFTLAL